MKVVIGNVQDEMFARAKAEFDSCIEKAYDFDGFMKALDNKHMVLTPWYALLLDLLMLYQNST